MSYFLIDQSHPKYQQILRTIKSQLRHFFGMSFDEDLYRFVESLLLQPDQKRTVITSEMKEIYGSDSSCVKEFLAWLWEYLDRCKKGNILPPQRPQLQKSQALSQPGLLSDPDEINNSGKKEENRNNELEHKEEDNHDQDKSKKTNILNRIKKPQENQPAKPRIFQNQSSLKRKMEAGGIGIIIANEKEQNKKIKTEKSDGVVVVPKKNEVVSNQIATKVEQIQEGTPIVKKKCRDWPLCKNEKCMFHHPTEECKFFPKCAWGSQCLYIHPAVDCLYGMHCQRVGCAFVHPKVIQPPYQQPFYKQKPKPFPNPQNRPTKPIGKTAEEKNFESENKEEK